eukprot:2385953-Rhodomonas_salina.2
MTTEDENSRDANRRQTLRTLYTDWVITAASRTSQTSPNLFRTAVGMRKAVGMRCKMRLGALTSGNPSRDARGRRMAYMTIVTHKKNGTGGTIVSAGRNSYMCTGLGRLVGLNC